MRLRELPLLRRAAAPVGVDDAEDDADEATAASTAKERAGGMNKPAAACDNDVERNDGDGDVRVGGPLGVDAPDNEGDGAAT